MKCIFCGKELNGVEHAPDTCISNLIEENKQLRDKLWDAEGKLLLMDWQNIKDNRFND